MLEMMNAINKEAKSPNEYAKFSREQKKIWDKTFGKGIFSDSLIKKVKTNKYTYSDMKIVANQLDDSVNKWCNGLNAVILSGKFNNFYKNDVGNSELDIWLQLCAKKPKSIFTVSSSKIKLNLPNVDLYDYKRFEPKCEPVSENVIKDAPICPNGQYCVYNSVAPVGTPLEGQTIGQYYECHNGICASGWICQMVELPQTQKTFIGTLELSKINFEIRPLGSNDFIAALNSGIQQSSSIKHNKDFTNYLLQMPTAQGIDITVDRTFPYSKTGFIIITTNDKINKLVKDVKDMRSSSRLQ